MFDKLPHPPAAGAPLVPQIMVEEEFEEVEGSLLATAAAMGADGSTTTRSERDCVSLGDSCYGVCFASNLPKLVY